MDGLDFSCLEEEERSPSLRRKSFRYSRKWREIRPLVLMESPWIFPQMLECCGKGCNGFF